jgi:4-carboxymuconolactone decarboxylase
VHNPKLAKVMGPLGAYFHTGYSLSEREREIAVCIINSKWRSIYQTNAHERAGKAAGLPAEKVEALLSGQSASFSDKREQVVYEMATCLSNSRWVSMGVFDRAVEALGHEGITDMFGSLAGVDRRCIVQRPRRPCRPGGRSPRGRRSRDRCRAR